MNNSILYAYEEALKKNKTPLFKQLNKNNFFEIAYFVMNIIFAIVAIALIIMNNKILVFWVAGFILAIIVWIIKFRKETEKNWKQNISKYDEELNLLKKILESQFNIEEKNEIKQLVRKYKNDINEYSRIDKKRKEKYTVLFGSYIIPIIAFCAGKLMDELKAEYIINICLVAIFTIIAVFLLGYAIGVIQTEIIDGNLIARKRYILKRLQDLLDRDFEVTDDDLIDIDDN